MIWLCVIGYLMAGCAMAVAKAFADGAKDDSKGLDLDYENTLPGIVLLWPLFIVGGILYWIVYWFIEGLNKVHDWAYEYYGKH